ncbi:MAG: CotH kinase family protein [Clostridiales bacterium]|nr:CotH kinase family protein [Clostridiales bacterium]
MYIHNKPFKNIIHLLLLLLLIGLLIPLSHCTSVNNTDITSQESACYLDIWLKVPDSVTLPELRLYCSQSGDCTFFLPSCVSLSEAVLVFDESCYQIAIDGAPVENAASLQPYDTDTAYSLTVNAVSDEAALTSTTPQTITFMQSQNLPSVFITTATGTMDSINASKEVSEAGTFTCLNVEGGLNSSGSLSKIKAHGNSSYIEVNKKSYQITFQTATDVLLMGTANKYILQANAFDDTYLRNKLVYDYCKDLGLAYTTDTEYVDLYFNGEYAGNYLLCEKVELNQSRVAVTNGYLLEKILHSRIEEDDQPFQVTDMGYFLVKNSDPVSEAELQSLSEYMNTVEALIQDCDSQDQYARLQEWIDTESFLNMYLINAITNDIDSNVASTYYYKKNDPEDSLLYAGPVWDYDNAWGRTARGQVAELNAYPTGYCEELFSISFFRDAVTEKYNETAYPLIQQYLNDYLPQYIERIASSIAMDAQRWQDDGYHSPHYTDYESAVSDMVEYIQTRTEHLYNRLNFPEQYHYILFINSGTNEEYRDTEYWIKDGETIPDDVIEEVKVHFFCETLWDEDGNPYTNSQPVTNDLVIYGK